MRLIKLSSPPGILGCSSVVGKTESQGPLSADFDMHCEDDTFGYKTWEGAESELQRRAVTLALLNAGIKETELNAVFAGDLLNQCTGSSYGLMGFNLPFFGLYGACSTFAEGLMLSALTVNAGYFKTSVNVSSSHFCSAERQFRFPLEYGGQRAPTAQRTCTAAGAMILSSGAKGPYIREVLPGKIVNKGVTDINNMGAAMAPAAIDTLKAYFYESGKKPSDFDLIITGDLGYEGFSIVNDFMKADNLDISSVYSDCGLLIYDREKQDVKSGGSGCGCSASVMCGHIYKRLMKRELNDILFIATGALMSTLRLAQGSAIPGIAHLVRISNKKED